MEIQSINNSYAAGPVANDLTGVQPPQTQNETDGMAWSGGGMTGASTVREQTRAMERASGLGNNVDLYV